MNQNALLCFVLASVRLRSQTTEFLRGASTFQQLDRANLITLEVLSLGRSGWHMHTVCSQRHRTPTLLCSPFLPIVQSSSYDLPTDINGACVAQHESKSMRHSVIEAAACAWHSLAHGCCLHTCHYEIEQVALTPGVSVSDKAVSDSNGTGVPFTIASDPHRVWISSDPRWQRA